MTLTRKCFILINLILLLFLSPAYAWETYKYGISNSQHSVFQTRQLPSEYNQKIETYSEAQIRAALANVKKIGLPYEFIKECCYERGYTISYKLNSFGIHHVRIVVTGIFKEIKDKWGRPVVWRTHTAPAIISHSGEIWMIDPALSDDPIRLHEWLAKIMNPQAQHKLSIMNQHLYSEDEIDANIGIDSFDRSNVWEVVNGGLLGCHVLQNQLNLKHKSTNLKAESCSMLPQTLTHTIENQVSDFWAQQLVGLDLSRDLMGEIKRYQKVHRPVVHIWDTKLETESIADHVFNHAYSVASFFNSGEHASTNVAVVGQTQDVIGNDNPYPAVIENIPESQFQSSQLINMSASWGRFNSRVQQTIERLSSKNAILVQANGNHALMGLRDSAFEPEDNRFIRVGNLTPEGLRSHNSSHRYDQNVLYAPADGFLTAQAKASGEFTRFGGTSGAAPLVTGAIANLLALNHDLNLTQVMNLISGRAFKMYDSDRKVSYRILNSYGSLIHSLPEKIRELEIHKNETTLPGAIDLIKSFYPDCGNNYQIKNTIQSCGDLKTSFDRIRKNFYMQPNVQLAELISCVYKKQNRTRESYFFKNWAASQQNRLHHGLKDQKISSSVFMRNLDLLLPAQAQQMVGHISFEKISKNSELLAAAFMRADLFRNQLERVYSELNDSRDKLYLLNNSILFPKARSLFYRLAAHDTNFEMRLASLDVFMNTQDEHLKQDLIYLIDEKNERIITKLVNYLEYCSSKTQKLILNRIFSQQIESFQLLIFDRWDNILKDNHGFVINQGSQSKFENVRSKARELKKNL